MKRNEKRVKCLGTIDYFVFNIEIWPNVIMRHSGNQYEDKHWIQKPEF